MKSRCLLPVLLAAAGLSPAWALDLTPPSKLDPPAYRVLEGVKIPLVVLQDGPRRVEWQAPVGWELRGSASLLSLRPPGASTPAMVLRLLPAKAARPPASDTARDDLLEWARPFLPGDAADVHFIREMPSPFLLGGLPSRELTFTYVSVRQACTTSIALVDLDNERSLAVILGARTADFPAIHSAGTGSMFRWHWIDLAPDRLAGRSSAVKNPAAAGVAEATASPERGEPKR